MGRVVPVIRAAQVRAIRRERDHLVIGLLHHPGRGLFGDDFPAILASSLECNLGWLAGGKRGEIGGLHPLAAFRALGGKSR